MPLWVDPYLAAVHGMTAGQERLYVRMLRAQWQRGGIPMDFHLLAIITALPVQEVIDNWYPQIAMQFPIVNGRMTHPRLEQNAQAALQVSEQRRASGAKGRKKQLDTRNAVAIAQVIDLQTGTVEEKFVHVQVARNQDALN
jgi:uncharacterized protein YdaU (DUF1376 family)